MKLNMYSVFDRCSGVYDRPWVAHSDPHAIRMFTDIASDADHPIGKHPEDFTLFRVGSWHDDLGEIVPDDAMKVINGAEAYAAARKQQPDMFTGNGETPNG